MKICVAQTNPVTSDVERNLAHHVELINIAVAAGAAMIVFPELSLTGYEPTLAKQLATTKDDQRFEVFQQISDAARIIVGVGMPLRSSSGTTISMILFQSKREKTIYSKQYLHTDEEPFFDSGSNLTPLIVDNTRIALAICYELSVPAHAEQAHANGATIYVASVAKFVNGIDKALTRLTEIAKTYAMPVMMANCIGYADGQLCAGRTSVFDNHGFLLAQLNSDEEGLLIFDTLTGNVIARPV
jgi:predicted amidohydrolase